ncbi:hypothetical protein ABEY69_00495 [Priestia filamentosa]|uniref:hypothetical protein n=1 Tax=Priestia filamentosa TaxID=1402861 RepID=UPI002E24B904|nr:hypothetical protein [Priestia filamentosa]
MKLKKLTIGQRLSIILPFIVVIASSLIFSKSYFNNKEINEFSEGCFNIGGQPVVEMSNLNLDYYFSCEESK